jgi:hypothetical protein
VYYVACVFEDGLDIMDILEGKEVDCFCLKSSVLGVFIVHVVWILQLLGFGYMTEAGGTPSCRNSI